jgi:TusA-related sulfurtransferase
MIIKPLSSIRCGEIVEWLTDSELSKRDFAAWSEVGRLN